MSLAGHTRIGLAALAAIAARGAPARADVDAAVAVGGGLRAAQRYASVEARLDLSFTSLRVGLAARGQWEEERWRREDFATAAGWAAAVRYLEWQRGDEDAEAALALGTLRPARLGLVSDGVQPAIDGQRHSGARVRLRAGRLELRGEVDDVVAPAVLGGAAAWRLSRWRAASALAIGLPTDGAAGTEAAAELSLAREFGPPEEEAALGAGAVVEPGAGAHVAGFAEIATRAARWTVTARAELRVGSGRLGAAFGPLYRVERWAASAPDAQAPDGALAREERRVGVAGGLSLRASRDGFGWFEGALRNRRRRGTLATAHLGAPLGAWGQAGAWLAVDARRAVLASELRAFGAGGRFVALEVSRFYEAPVEQMAPAPRWALVAWVGLGR
ncbi:MAG: hypothetical protein R3B48_09015 [Kofleriaceae bacterium]